MSPRTRRAVLVGAQTTPRALVALLREHRVTSRDLIIGVDGGVWALASTPVRKLKTQFALGDWDSLAEHGDPRRFLRGISYLTLPQEKDRSDLHYALDVVASSRSIGEVLCFGVTGGRADHHLAALYELGAHAGAHGSVKISAHDENESYYWVTPQKSLTLATRPGRVLSLFSWGSQPGQSARGVSTRGLKYRLENERLEAHSRGLSNVTTSNRVSVSLRQGQLLLIAVNA